MFIYSIRASRLKYVAVMAICVVAVASCVILIPDNASGDTATVQYTEASARKPGDFKNVSTNEDRVSFLESYGWDVDPNAVEIEEVVIPSEFDEVYNAYNEIQKKEGLDLKKYAGKSVKKYTYTVGNYGAETTVLASVLVYKNKIIGGDISSADPNGFSHGFTKTDA